MQGKSVFSKYESDEICNLLSEIRKADRERQKTLRNKLRTNFSFYISDFGRSNSSGFTRGDFEELIRIGKILINSEPNSTNLPLVIDLHGLLLDQCIWLRTCYNSSELLFDDENVEISELLKFADEKFFANLSIVFQEYVIILIYKLTDKPQNGKNENVSTQNLNKKLCESGYMTQEIKNLSDKLIYYRESYIRDSRNKIIGHADKETLMWKNTLGKHTEEEANGFFSNLQKYMDSVGCLIGVGPGDFTNPDPDGSGTDLILCLRYLREFQETESQN